MSAATSPPPATATTTEEEERKRRLEEDDTEELIGKLYDAFAKLGTAIEKLTTSISSASEAQRGLMESLGKKLDTLEKKMDEIHKAFQVGLEQIASAHAKADKFSGGPKSPEAVGETVSLPNPSSVQQEMLEKAAQAVRESKVDVVKSVVTTPRAGIEIRNMSGDEYMSLVREVLGGKVRSAGELADRTRPFVRVVREA